MPDTTQEQLLRAFEEAAGKEASADTGGGESYHLTGASDNKGSSDTAPKGNPDPIPPNTAPTGNTGITAESVATTVLESGLGLVPLILGIVGLFEGGQAAPEVLTKYAMPDSMQFEGDASSGDIGIDGFDQMGVPRAGTATPDGAATQIDTLQGTMASTTLASPPATSSPVAPAHATAAQTMIQPGDPQWFMDHSSDIAQAVRSAMLNLSSLNDVVSDL